MCTYLAHAWRTWLPKGLSNLVQGAAAFTTLVSYTSTGHPLLALAQIFYQTTLLAFVRCTPIVPLVIMHPSLVAGILTQDSHDPLASDDPRVCHLGCPLDGPHQLAASFLH